MRHLTVMANIDVVLKSGLGIVIIFLFFFSFFFLLRRSEN